jgi:hypothetical protein
VALRPHAEAIAGAGEVAGKLTTFMALILGQTVNDQERARRDPIFGAHRAHGLRA